MARELTDEDIARITAEPKGEFRPTRTAEAIIKIAREGQNPLIDELWLREAQMLSDVWNKPVCGPGSL